METFKNNKVLSGILVVILLIILSVTVLFATGRFSEQASYVEVKGLSEKIVKADIAIWSMNFEVKSNDIDSLYAETERNITAIKTFLKAKGFEDSEINVAAINIYQDTYRDAIFRYNSNDQISVYTKKVDLAKSASNETLLLVKKGVVLNQNSISFEFSVAARIWISSDTLALAKVQTNSPNPRQFTSPPSFLHEFAWRNFACHSGSHFFCPLAQRRHQVGRSNHLLHMHSLGSGVLWNCWAF